MSASSLPIPQALGPAAENPAPDGDPRVDAAAFDLVPIEDVQYIKGIAFPASMKFRQLIVTGPPGCGKTKLINQIGGWPEEGYIDLTLKHWWRAQSLTYRPREVHFGFPFVGFEEPQTVFDKAWLETEEPPRLDFARIVLPPRKTHFWTTDWRNRYAFEFLLPPAEKIFEWRLERSRRVSHPVDAGVTLAQVERQTAVFREIALYFHRHGILMYVRDEFEGVPKTIRDPDIGEEIRERQDP